MTVYAWSPEIIAQVATAIGAALPPGLPEPFMRPALLLAARQALQTFGDELSIAMDGALSFILPSKLETNQEASSE